MCAAISALQGTQVEGRARSRATAAFPLKDGLTKTLSVGACEGKIPRMAEQVNSGCLKSP